MKNNKIIKDKIIQILKGKTEDNEMVQGDVVSYVPDWEFEEVANEILKLVPIQNVNMSFCDECRDRFINPTRHDIKYCGCCSGEINH